MGPFLLMTFLMGFANAEDLQFLTAIPEKQEWTDSEIETVALNEASLKNEKEMIETESKLIEYFDDQIDDVAIDVSGDSI